MPLDFLYPSLLPIIVMLTLLILIIFSTVGKALRIPEMDAYLNIELHNLILAVITVSLILSSNLGFDLVARSLLYSVDPNYVDIITSSKSFLNIVINNGVLPMYRDLLIIESGTALTSSFTYRIGPAPWSYVYKVEPGADAVLAMTRMLSFGLLIIYGSLSFQYIGLSVVGFAMPIALSLGLLLFIFPPTREAGAFLIAFAFAFQTIFPFTYVIHEVILNDIWSAHGWGDKYAGYTPEIFNLKIRGASTVVAFLTSFATFTNFILLIPFINAMAHLALLSLFLPAFSLVLTIAFMNAIIKVLMAKI